jgi:hypothetical protein
VLLVFLAYVAGADIVNPEATIVLLSIRHRLTGKGRKIDRITELEAAEVGWDSDTLKSTSLLSLLPTFWQQ